MYIFIRWERFFANYDLLIWWHQNGSFLHFIIHTFVYDWKTTFVLNHTFGCSTRRASISSRSIWKPRMFTCWSVRLKAMITPKPYLLIEFAPVKQYQEEIYFSIIDLNQSFKLWLLFINDLIEILHAAADRHIFDFIHALRRRTCYLYLFESQIVTGNDRYDEKKTSC